MRDRWTSWLRTKFRMKKPIMGDTSMPPKDGRMPRKVLRNGSVNCEEEGRFSSHAGSGLIDATRCYVDEVPWRSVSTATRGRQVCPCPYPYPCPCCCRCQPSATERSPDPAPKSAAAPHLAQGGEGLVVPVDVAEPRQDHTQRQHKQVNLQFTAHCIVLCCGPVSRCGDALGARALPVASVWAAGRRVPSLSPRHYSGI